MQAGSEFMLATVRIKSDKFTLGSDLWRTSSDIKVH
jgi:hypothetical protein